MSNEYFIRGPRDLSGTTFDPDYQPTTKPMPLILEAGDYETEPVYAPHMSDPLLQWDGHPDPYWYTSEPPPPKSRREQRIDRLALFTYHAVRFLVKWGIVAFTIGVTIAAAMENWQATLGFYAGLGTAIGIAWLLNRGWEIQDGLR